jgi:hypothetical protein
MLGRRVSSCLWQRFMRPLDSMTSVDHDDKLFAEFRTTCYGMSPARGPGFGMSRNQGLSGGAVSWHLEIP